MRKTLVSGIQSSGKLHIGNYFGAIRQNIELGNSPEYEAFVFLADYHSMTSLQDGKERLKNTFDAAATYLACGLDPKKAVLFKQSDIPEHAELAWILGTLTPLPMLELAHAFKDHQAKKKDVNAGLFTYPVLMAADILMYNAEVVPVGKDQEQHVEIAREIAGKYNRAYGETFKMPQAMIKKDVATVPGVDGEKMSKSKDNHIPLFADEAEVKKRIMSIVTDSASPEDKKDPDANNIYRIHRLFLGADEDRELREKFSSGGYGYKEAKEALVATFLEWRAPCMEKYRIYKDDPDQIWDILEEGKGGAEKKAKEMMEKVKKTVGLIR